MIFSKETLESLGLPVQAKSSTTYVVSVDGDRKAFLAEFAKLYNGTYEKVAPGSSVGRVKVGSFYIYAKGGKKDPTGYEREVVDAFNKEFDRTGPIDIKIPKLGVFKDIVGAIQVDTNIKRSGGARSDPKADIILYSDPKKLLDPKNIFISHKKEGGPEAFQQYGGLTEAAGDLIYRDKEVQSFLRSVALRMAANKGKLPGPIMKKVKSPELMNRSIYGVDWSTRKNYSLQHTQLIGQGQPKLEESLRDQYLLSFTSHMSVSGDLSHFTGDYTPVFGATYRAGRGFDVGGKRYNDVRVGIYPLKLMRGRGGLITLK